MDGNNQTLILVDRRDKSLGYESKEKCHTGLGKRHRAFVTLLFDDKNRILLQRRKHRLFDGFWDLTAISHPLYINGRNEVYQQASDRALKKEMGIGHVAVDKVGAFNYFAKDGKNCENEYCTVLTGEYSGKFKPNNKEVYKAKWVGYEDFIEDIAKNPSKFTPWAKETARILASRGLLIFDHSDQSAFSKELELFTKEFTKFSKQFFSKKQKLVEKYSSLIARFYKEIEEYGKGGKAMRPFLVYLGFRIGPLGRAARGSDPKRTETILPICLAIELIHNFLLIHDDIIDKSIVRRGKPTVHKKFEKGRDNHYGVSQAIIAGDIALLEVFDLMNKADFSDKLKSECLDVLLEVILETCYGEAMDVDNAYRRLGLGDVWQVTELKTARYSFVGPLTLGAILAGVKKSQTEALEEFGLKLGKAFQIQDDILGVFGSEKVIGKSTLSDMREGKNTLLFYKAREFANKEQKAALGRIWGSPKSGMGDLKAVKEIMRKTQALAWCERKMKELINDAKQSIPKISKDRGIRELFAGCADFVIYRAK